MNPSRRVVLISDVARLDPEGATHFTDAGFEPLPRHDLVHVGSPDQLRTALDGAWAVVAGSERYDRELIRALTSLRAIARPGVGYDAIDVEAATQRGVAVLTTPNTNDESVADHTVALMLTVMRRILEHDATLRAGGWRSASLARDLSAARVGIVGLGSIGRGVARRLAGFGARLMATDPYADQAFCRELGVELVALDELASRSDVLTIHVPFIPETERLIDERIIQSMPPGSIIVNTARGRIVDEVAMVAALRSGHLAGAGLDVFAAEPIGRGHPLVGLPNVVLTAHAAAFSREAIRKMLVATVAGLSELARGEIPRGLVNLRAIRSDADQGSTG